MEGLTGPAEQRIGELVDIAPVVAEVDEREWNQTGSEASSSQVAVHVRVKTLRSGSQANLECFQRAL